MADEQLTNVGPGATEQRSVSATAEIFRSKGLAKEMGFGPEPEAQPAPEEEPAYEPAPNTATEAEEAPDDVTPPPAQPEEPPSPPEPVKFKVKYKGQELEVNEDELKAGYTRKVDWDASRAEIEADKAKIAAERNHYAQQLQTFIPGLQQQIAAEFADIKTINDVQTMAAEDPARFTKWQARQLMLAQAQSEQQRVSALQQKEQEDAWQKRVSEEAKKLGEHIPEFKDESKREPFMQRLRGYLKSEIGYSEDEISRAADHRDIIIAEKARKWDEAEKAKKAVKTADVPTPVKPGRATSPAGKGEEINAARGALKKSGSLGAFADVLKRRGLN